MFFMLCPGSNITFTQSEREVSTTMKKLFGVSLLGLLLAISPQAVYSQNNDNVTPAPDPDGAPGQGGNRSNTPGIPGGNRSNVPGGGYYPNDEEPWFGNEGLQQELDLDDDQVRRLNDAYGATWKQMRANQSDSGSDLDE